MNERTLPRNNRLCFRLDRPTYWAIKEQARLLDMTPSTWLNWVFMAYCSEVAELGPEGKALWVSERLGPIAKRRFLAAVEKALDELADREVPW